MNLVVEHSEANAQDFLKSILNFFLCVYVSQNYASTNICLEMLSFIY